MPPLALPSVTHSCPSLSFSRSLGVFEYVDDSEHSLHLECLSNRRLASDDDDDDDDDDADDDDHHQWT